MNFEITILGSGSASPRIDRMPSSHHVKIHNMYFLLDCGECTQFQMLKYKISALKLDAIFITHLHGDHYLGLPGLLTTMSMFGRKRKLQIYSPKGLKELIEAQLFHDKVPMNYEPEFIEIDCSISSTLFQTKEFSITNVPLNHGIECTGYVFKENFKSRKILKSKIADLTIAQIRKLKKGYDIKDDSGSILFKNSDYVESSEPNLSYAYISDTQYLESIIPHVQNVTLLYHEATFLEALRERATKTYHSTVVDACTIAQKASVKKLIIGHFSSRYHDLEPFLNEGKPIFDNLVLAEDGMKILLSSVTHSHIL